MITTNAVSWHSDTCEHELLRELMPHTVTASISAGQQRIPASGAKYLPHTEVNHMNNWNRLLQALDDTLGFPNKIDSTVKKDRQFYDPTTNEHVFLLRYRVKVAPGAQSQSQKTRLLDSILDRGN